MSVRGERWRLDASIEHPDCRELHLSSARERRVLLWPFDRPVRAGSPHPRIQAVSIRRWNRLASAVVEHSVDPLTPRARCAGGILAYQIAPAVAMAAGATRMLLADEVGLGKTVQAGWIVADLLAREPSARVLIEVPASLRAQWAIELERFFHMETEPVDAAWLRRTVAARPANVSPWAAPGVYLGSIDFFKRPDVAASIEAVTWDLLIVDEAHAATAPTDRHAALAAAAARSRRIVTITATPYSGDPAAFTSMLSLGAMPGEDPPVMFRRSREDAGDPRRRRHVFMPVRLTRAEAQLQRLLHRYSRDVWRHAPGDRDGARLAVTILRKRALSSPAAALRSLARRLDLLTAGPQGPRQLSLFGDEAEADDDLRDAALATPGFSDAGLEQRWLGAMIAAATQSAAMDSKLARLLRLLRRLPGEAAIVFTEYRDTLSQLAAALPNALQLHGGLSHAERHEVQRRFNEDGGLLLATDAAADGLNLQRRCRLLVNYELPWNPARLEQRIGRIDRIGQRRTVHAISLVARDTAEDLVIANLTRRLARVAAALGERDRLGAFLTEARAAQCVIGGAPVTWRETPPPAVAPSEPRCDESELASHVARIVRRSQVPAPAADIPVARVRARRILVEGLVAIVHYEARAEDGFVAGDCTRIFHVAAARAAARAGRVDAAAAFEPLRAAIEGMAFVPPDVTEWYGGVRLRYDRARERFVTRETALRDRASSTGEHQPGFFDSRGDEALSRRRHGDGGQASGRQRRDAHDERIRALHSRTLRLTGSLAAGLIVCR